MMTFLPFSGICDKCGHNHDIYSNPARIADLERQLDDTQKLLKGRYDQISEQARTIAEKDAEIERLRDALSCWDNQYKNFQGYWSKQNERD